MSEVNFANLAATFEVIERHSLPRIVSHATHTFLRGSDAALQVYKRMDELENGDYKVIHEEWITNRTFVVLYHPGWNDVATISVISNFQMP